KRFLEVFGVALEWSEFPIVRVREVSPAAQKSSAMAVGDILIVLAGNRITLLAQAKGSDPNAALLSLCEKALKQSKSGTVSFIFVRGTVAERFMQLSVPKEAVSDPSLLGLKLDRRKTTTIASVTPGSWAEVNVELQMG
ncbi:unnamed protein product, partial [Amoebophrya sp. A25]